ncbi:sensor histidine kinase [Dactylosporangium sp. NPDC048998]|uniref:sensor histidine kinase n=1 Tax=Dactylosporangium sp. NPDC048998 TaxID=3363976 RepID=UPI0037237192
MGLSRERRLGALLGRTPLSVKLVVAVLGLVTGAVSLMGAATVTVLREELTSRVDDQLADLGEQARGQISAGHTELVFHVPQDHEQGVQIPDPYIFESLAANGSLVDSRPAPLPADAPELTGAGLSEIGPFTLRARTGSTRWRVLVVAAPDGQHVVIAANLSDVDRTVGRLIWLVLLVGLSIVAMVAGVGIWLVRSSLRPLAHIERTATAIAAGDLSQRAPEQDPRTEVGRLGHAFNVMIARIEHAFTAQLASEATARSSEARAVRSEQKMRQFVADASHELRTPLTVIRGSAELYRHGAVQNQEDVASLLRRIEDQARRMSVLVDDLLLLARLDQQRPLAAEPVDLVALAADVIDSSHAVAPDRPLALDVATPAPLIVIGDEHRLRQVIANLVTNAITHTAAEAEVTVRISRRQDQAVVEVIDTGEGLSPQQTQRVFERFYRADPARTRTDATTGAGLGLAIVAAIVAAHAGAAEVDSTPGRTTTFRIILPMPAAGAGRP